MSSFTDPLHVVHLPARGLWRTTRAFTYWTACSLNLPETLPPEDRCRTAHTVPDGFETDFASIPALFWPVIGHPAGQYAQAAVLHDYLYCNAIATRREADRVFREAMTVLEVPAWRRWVMWVAVRVGGHGAYTDA